MNRTIPAVIGLAVIGAACIGGRAWADEVSRPSADWTVWIDGAGIGEMAFGGRVTAGPWTFGPMAAIRASRDELSGIGMHNDTPAVGLGFRGAAKVDSRFGAIHSRLSLSFERAFGTDGHQAATGYSIDGGNGDYAHRSEIDLMKFDADFAIRMSPAVTGFVDYGAESDLGSGAEHRIALRLKFDF